MNMLCKNCGHKWDGYRGSTCCPKCKSRKIERVRLGVQVDIDAFGDGPWEGAPWKEI